ncbi:MAG: DUF2807 domain-containing protein [Acidobacteria bacterium]|nr:DUF2807 domain-containing protein [Acidobacteriota bacterium]
MKRILFLIASALAVAAVAGCGLSKTNSRSDSDQYATEKRDGFGFREIRAGRDVILIVEVQKEYDVAVEGPEKLLRDVKTEVSGETLIITTGGEITPSNKMRLKISTPELLNLELWGASEATVRSVSGDSLKLQVGGSSSLTIDGRTKKLDATANGASRIDGENLKTETAEVRANGSSEITCFVADDLTAEAFGASTVFYLGDPKNVKPAVAGAGEVRKK